MAESFDDGLSRRGFLKGTAAGFTGLSLMAAIPGWALRSPGDAAGDPHSDMPPSAPSGPLVAYVRDAKKGEVVIMAGTREVVRKDPHLVACLTRALG